MEDQRQKRSRDEESEDSDDLDFKSSELTENPVSVKLSSNISPPLPKLSTSDSGSLPQKKPKLWEYESRKPIHSIHSGTLQCIKTIQNSIATCDYDSILLSLRKLTSELTMSNDEHLSLLPIDLLIEVLIFALNVLENPEIILQAIICMAFLVESHHNAVPCFVKAGMISMITGKLINVEYIDLAEYAVKILEKVSADYPIEVLREGFLSEVLGMLEFFELSVQKKILSIVLNMSRAISTIEDFANYLSPSLPSIFSLLANRVKEKSHFNEKALDILVALYESMRIVAYEESFSQILLENNIVPMVCEGISEMPMTTAKSFKLLSVMCKNSLKLSIQYINTGLGILDNAVRIGINEGNTILLTESLQLVYSIVPNEGENEARKEFFMENQQLVEQLTKIIFPNMTSIYEVLTKKNVKILLLTVITNLIILGDQRFLMSYEGYSGFLTHLLVEKEVNILKCALKIVSTLYDKIPDTISTSFVREGVVQRFKALKYPENLKNVAEEKYSDPLEFEQFLINFRRTRAYLEQQEFSTGTRPRFLSECRDQTFDQKKEIIALSKSIIEKHSACRNKAANATAKALKNIAGCFEIINEDESDKLWKDFAQVIEQGKPTAFEFCSSGFSEKLWTWLSCEGKIYRAMNRYEGFCKFLLENTSTGETMFSKVLSLALQSFMYLENSVTSGGYRGLPARGYMQKTKVQLGYIPMENPPDDLKSRNSFLSSLGKFTVVPDPCCSICTLKTMLKKIDNKEELSFFKESIKDDPMDFEDDVILKDINIKFYCKDVELTDEVLIGDIVANSSTMPLLSFHFDIEDYKCEYLDLDSQIYENFLKKCSSVGLDQENPAYPYLRLLNLLFGTFHSYPLTTHKLQFHLNNSHLSSFICPKLNSIILKQFQEPISLSRRVLPFWMKELPKYSWFLFTYSTRLKILDNIRFMHSESYRMPRQKVKINREKILDCAYIIMNDLALLQHGILEIQYENEVGTGNGPTLEFFTLLSEEIRNLNIWRKGTVLFPAPYKVIENNVFHFIGRVVGKAILDKRYIELPLSPVFWKLVQNKPLSFNDLQEVDPVLHKTLKDFKDFIKESHINKHAKYKDIDIEDLHLFFTLPGYENLDLMPNGKSIPITKTNLEDYIKLVCQQTLIQTPLIKEFRDGLSSLIPIECLQGFSAEELEEMICGSSNEIWDLETLRTSIKPAYGYTENSMTFQNLLLIMTEFTPAEQRKFLQFTTGCPRLPIGGFFGLTPSLTVVRKEDGEDPDKYLPSVMTCQNYLKLPNYSSLNALRKNLNIALEEGHRMFHLS
ncbi:hypothetical protein SteCoe_17026 [Stentor coeruleus]|uniref:HECT-type E3 ubiquitin transferase n=1 Tax=Stentor coeruleus TaxID=5963 RepID=A0A1R2BZY3_9CILI|nr:hypothetical protein SteCoe_17026 [Stentor coeruleus]